MNISELPFLKTLNNDLVLSVYVQPRASKNQICGVQGEELKLRLTSPPVDGAANKLCRSFVADLFDVSRSSVEIISGETSRHKRLRIIGRHSGQFIRQISALEESLNQGIHTERK
ncbi:MAG: DUF167 family protein [Desulfuromonadaceae bacterium]|nr:DUF167 family protein [Desulfuromonadaceae bacterium]